MPEHGRGLHVRVLVRRRMSIGELRDCSTKSLTKPHELLGIIGLLKSVEDAEHDNVLSVEKLLQLAPAFDGIDASLGQLHTLKC